MRPINELIGRTIDEISAEELLEECNLRMDKFKSLDWQPDKNLTEAEKQERLKSLRVFNREVSRIQDELARVTFHPRDERTPHFSDSNQEMAFQAGIEFERRRAQQAATSKRYMNLRISKFKAAIKAIELFDKDPQARLVDVAMCIALEQGIDSPQDADIRRIKGWLKEAAEKGVMKIPESASKPGAPEK